MVGEGGEGSEGPHRREKVVPRPSFVREELPW